MSSFINLEEKEIYTKHFTGKLITAQKHLHLTLGDHKH